MKKTPTTTALALPTMPAIQPKPTKTEVIEALVARAKIKITAENEARAKVRESLIKKIKALASRQAKGMAFEVNIYSSGNPDRCCCAISTTIRTPELVALMIELNAASSIRWDERDTRAAIKRELSGINKPNPTRLLDDPNAVKAMDAMLKQWGI